MKTLILKPSGAVAIAVCALAFSGCRSINASDDESETSAADYRIGGDSESHGLFYSIIGQVGQDAKKFTINYASDLMKNKAKRDALAKGVCEHLPEAQRQKCLNTTIVAADGASGFAKAVTADLSEAVREAEAVASDPAMLAKGIYKTTQNVYGFAAGAVHDPKGTLTLAKDQALALKDDAVRCYQFYKGEATDEQRAAALGHIVVAIVPAGKAVKAVKGLRAAEVVETAVRTGATTHAVITNVDLKANHSGCQKSEIKNDKGETEVLYMLQVEAPRTLIQAQDPTILE